jgi:hypothetical protein
MMPWFFRYIARMAGYLAAMLLVVWIGFVLYRQSGIDRVYWVPVNFGIVAVAGYDTVKRLPLVWGALVGGLVAGIVDLCTWPLGTLVGQGRLAMPPEADPSLLVAVIVGAVVGGVAGMTARSRRRKRSRRSALRRLQYSAFDESVGVPEEARDAV